MVYWSKSFPFTSPRAKGFLYVCVRVYIRKGKYAFSVLKRTLLFVAFIQRNIPIIAWSGLLFSSTRSCQFYLPDLIPRSQGVRKVNSTFYFFDEVLFGRILKNLSASRQSDMCLRERIRRKLIIEFFLSFMITTLTLIIFIPLPKILLVS